MTKTQEKPLYLGHRQRLKERFLKDEGSSMADYELLELVLTYAIPRRDVKEDAKKLISYFGSFASVVNASQENLLSYGLSKNTITLLKLIKSSLMRLTLQSLCENDEPIYANYDSLLDFCKTHITNHEIEEFHVMFLDAGRHFLSEKIMNAGTIDKVAVYPREVLKEALQRQAKGCVLFHNHPGGTLTPSKADIELTKAIALAVNSCDIKVYDHFIITKDGYYSFRNQNLLSNVLG